MAATTQKSTQLTNRDASPLVRNLATDVGGKLRIMLFNFTQSGAGDAGSVAQLCKLPAGRHRILCALSRVAFSAMGTSRVLDMGHEAYTDIDGDAVAANDDAFTVTAIDVENAGVSALSSAANSEDTVLIESKEEVTIIGTVSGGTFPDADTLDGYIVYVTE